MPTRDIVLTDRQAELVDALVRSGRYQNVSEVLQEGLQLVERRTREDSARLEVLKNAADNGWSDMVAGRYVDVATDELGDYVAELGWQAAERVLAAR